MTNTRPSGRIKGWWTMKRKLSELTKEEFNNFHENKVHGTALRPFAKYSTLICDKLPTISAHWHEEMEIMKVQEGSGSVCIDDKWFSVHKGDILFVNPKIIHSIARFKKDDMLLDTIIFNLHSLESTNADSCTIKYLAPIINGQYLVTRVIRTKHPDYHVFDQNMTTIMQAYNDGIPGWEMAVKANLFWLFYHLYRLGLVHKSQKIDEEQESESIKPAIDYIRENYAEEISINKLATLCGYSDTYFMKLFKKTTGIDLRGLHQRRASVPGGQPPLGDQLLHHRYRARRGLQQRVLLQPPVQSRLRRDPQGVPPRRPRTAQRDKGNGGHQTGKQAVI